MVNNNVGRITIKFLSINRFTFMPSVLVGQDCKYNRNFEALSVKEYLTQVLAKSYGAPEESCEIHLYNDCIPLK